MSNIHSNKLQDIISYYSKKLSNHLIDNATNEIIWFLEHYKILFREQIYTKSFDDKNLNQIESKINHFVKERVTGKPLQYILNNSVFYGRNFYVNHDVLIPRPESELLIDIVKTRTFNHVLDIGTGSGNLAITLIMENIVKQATAIDISAKALKIAKKNAKFFNLDQINFKKIDFLSYDFPQQQFDLIVANPPYISLDSYNQLTDSVKCHEPKIALTDDSDGMLFYYKILNVVKDVLLKDGVLICEIGIDQNLDILFKLFQNQGYKVSSINDYNNIPRIIEVC